MAAPRTFTAFQAGGRVAAGTLGDIIDSLGQRGLKLNRVMVFNDATGDLLKLNTDDDLTVAKAEPVAQMSASPVTLEVRIPERDRDWLERQSGGSSAAIRRLVSAARRDPASLAREAQSAAYRFISMLAGDLPGYEEACRALFAGALDRFDAATAAWAPDIRAHARRLGWRTRV